MSIIERIAERRISPRAAIGGRVYVSEPSAPCSDVPGDEELLVPLFGRAVNLSETGVLIEVDEPLCLGRRVIVTIEIEDGPRVNLRGRITRTTRMRASARFRLGVRFDPLTAEQLEAVRDAVRDGLIASYLN